MRRPTLLIAATVWAAALSVAPLAAQDPTPAGAISYFDSGCPEGWERYELGAGRALVPVSDDSSIERGVGTPLAEGEQPQHSHEGEVSLMLDGSRIRQYEPWSQTFEIANVPLRRIDMNTSITDTSSELPVAKLETCIKREQPQGEAPPGMLFFFADLVCPTGWSRFEEAEGRILAGADQTPGAFGATRALSDGEQRLHSHLIGGPAELETIELTVWSGCNTCTTRWVLEEFYQYRGQARQTDSGLPYLQLLACSKDAPSGPQISRAVHGADFTERPLAAGQHATLFGTELGPMEGAGATLDADGEVSRIVAGVRVLVDEVEAPLFFVRQDQINFQVPFEVDGRAAVGIRVVRDDVEGPEFEAALAPAAPALFAWGSDPSQAIAVYADGSLNEEGRPAEPGQALVFYATGGGQTTPPGRTGAPAEQPFPAPLANIELWIGGEQAVLDYAGAAPGFVGLLQINARMPDASGKVRVVLRAGQSESVAETYVYGQP